MKITLLLACGIVLVGLNMLAISGFIQGEFETIPEGVTWMRAMLEDGIRS